MSKAKSAVSKVMLGCGLVMLLVAVACGTAATTTPAPAAGRTPGVAPAATPTPTPPPAPAPAVSPGKVTWMVTSFGEERFDITFSGSPSGSQDYARQIHAFLISSDVKEGKRVRTPGLATKWEVSGDMLTWTLTIREGVKFHNGTEVTAQDVLWTLRNFLGPQAKEYATSGTSLTWAPLMDRIEQTGPDRVSVTTKKPASDFPVTISDMTGHWGGVVLPKRATLHHLGEEAAYDRNPIGAGIMRLVKHVPAAQMTMERFADYYHQPKNGFPEDKRVNFQSLDLFLVPEEATRVAALRAGEADIAPVSLGVREQVEAGGGRLVFGQEGLFFDPVLLGCFKPQFPCHDKRVRQSLNYAIDKELMRDHLYGGPKVMQVKGWFPVSPTTIGYSPGLDPFPFDPAKARQLLAEAGYPGGKGFGKLVINTWVSSALPLMPESAQVAADFWRRELGLDVAVKLVDRVAFKKYRASEDAFGQISWGDNETRIDASERVRKVYGEAANADKAHNDPELFALVQETMAVFDPVERDKALNSVYRRLRDEAYQIPLGYLNIPWGVGPRIRTWEPYPLAFYASALHTITLK